MEVISTITDNPTISILAGIGAYSLFVLASRFFALYRNIRLLKSLNVPNLFYTIHPLEESTIPSMVLRNLPIWKIPIKWLNSIGWAKFDEYLRYNWRWEKRIELGQRGGLVFLISPERIVVEICDADVVNYLVGKEGRALFAKPKVQYEMIDIFGDNIVTCYENQWPRHRRVAAPAFNEKSYALAWRTSIAQATGMKWDWTHWGTRSTMPAPATSPATATKGALEHPIIHTPGEDVKKFALHVIAGAAFGVDLPYSDTASNFQGEEESTDPQEIEIKKILNWENASEGYHLTFQASIGHLTDHFIQMLLGLNLWPFWAYPAKGGDGRLLDKRPRFMEYLPKSLQVTSLFAWVDFGKYIRVLIDRERANQISGGGKSRDNLLSFLVQSQMALEKAQENVSGDEKKSPAGRVQQNPKVQGLTREETVGNAYIFTFAGHETTTGTLEYSFIMLALHPEVQDWLIENLDKELEGLSEDPLKWDYEEVYPRLVSAKCLMYEILRLFPPVTAIPKWIDPAVHSTPQTLMVPSGKPDPAEAMSDLIPVLFPPGTCFDLNCFGLHYNQRYYGPDAHVFRPSRWYRPQNPTEHESEFLARFAHDPTTNSPLRDSLLSEQGLYTPRKGSFLPFSYGHRACLGKKFAVVEYCAAISVVLKEWRLELADHTLSAKGKGMGGKKGLSKEELVKHAWEMVNTTHGSITMRAAEGVALKLVRRK